MWKKRLSFQKALELERRGTADICGSAKRQVEFLQTTGPAPRETWQGNLKRRRQNSPLKFIFHFAPQPVYSFNVRHMKIVLAYSGGLDTSV